MQKQLGKIAAVLSGRIARNIYFWAMLAYTRSDFNYTPAQVGYTAVLFLLLAILLYTNNLLLIPRYLSRKRYTAYLLRYIPLTLAISAAYIGTLKLALSCFPTLHPGNISPLILGGETGSLTPAAFLNEWWPYMIMIFIVGAIFAMSWYVTDYQRQLKILAQTKKQHAEMELSLLKYQINPHFLFNSLNNLYALTVKKSDDAPEVVSRIASILRYLLYESDAATVSFEKEKEIMLAYKDLELIRMTDTSHLHFTISADKDYQIPPLLWLPILENVFKHGTRFIAGRHYIDFSFTIINDVLNITASNDFRQSPEPHATPASGIGLMNLKQRLNLLYDGRYTMHTTTHGDRYNISITIKLKDV
jgi:two-component system, LytTR family, sensor kinase